jgi:hypothetical protein
VYKALLEHTWHSDSYNTFSGASKVNSTRLNKSHYVDDAIEVGKDINVLYEGRLKGSWTGGSLCFQVGGAV